jgi:hypothetical protein
VDQRIIYQAKRFVELEDEREGKLQDASYIPFVGHFTSPHSQRGFGRSFNGPAQSDE